MERQNEWVNTHHTFVILMVCGLSLAWACDQPIQPSPLPSGGPAVPVAVSPGGPSGPTGSYALTLTASPSCANGTNAGHEAIPFPDSVRVRRYDAEFARGAATLKATDGTGNEVRIGGVDTYYSPGTPLMTLKDDTLTIVVLPADGRSGLFGYSLCDIDGFSWYEVSKAGTAFALCGTFRGSATDPSGFQGTITGSFEYYLDSESRAPASCYATDHQFTLTRMER